MRPPDAERRPLTTDGAHHTNSLTVIVPDAADITELSDERDRWLRRVLAAELRGYDRGRAAGYDAGYRQGAADADSHWMWVLAPARHAAGVAARYPAHAEMDRVVAGMAVDSLTMAKVRPPMAPALVVCVGLSRIGIGSLSEVISMYVHLGRMIAGVM